MQLRIWIALLSVINVGLLYFVVEAWHAQEAGQLAEVTGRQSAVEEGGRGVNQFGNPHSGQQTKRQARMPESVWPDANP